MGSTSEPLKLLPKYVEAEISRKLNALSHRIAKIVERFHLQAAFAFENTRLEREGRRKNAYVRARVSPRTSETNATRTSSRSFQIDASLVANASWMRALLWAFVFALRQERSEKLNGLPLPLLLMDDPQATFDIEHRCAWIEYVLGNDAKRSIAPPTQPVFATFDVSFARDLDLLVPNIDVRHITAPSSVASSVFVDGTTLVDRFWLDARKKQTNTSASLAVGQLRIHLEEMLKVIFPVAMGGTERTLGQLMIQFASRLKQPNFPYDRREFSELVTAWDERDKVRYRKALSEPHHSFESPYDYNFAKELFGWYHNALRPRFQDAFETIWRVREAGWRLPQSTAIVPAKVIKLNQHLTNVALPSNLSTEIGRVAAETDGREAELIDGQPAIRFAEHKITGGELCAMEAVTLAAATLEPEAQVGDVLLLSDSLPATQNSLVVCKADGAFRARRFSALSGASRNAVLVASANNPREIRNPILVDWTPDAFRKVVGIIYRHDWAVPPTSTDEVVALQAPGKLEALLGQAEGRVRVLGSSAEPLALDGQSLVLGPPVSNQAELGAHAGKPMVVVRNGRAVFKRLRLTHGQGPIVLESLDASGLHPPIVLEHSELIDLHERISFRPVLGVLFDAQKPKH